MKTQAVYLYRSKLTRILSFLFLAGMASLAGAATIDVNTTDDTIADDGFCSLREAVIAANTNTASGVTAGECVAGEATPTVDDINIPADTYVLAIDPVDNTLAGAHPTYTYGEYTLDWNAGKNAYVATATPDASNGDLDITESVNLVGEDMATTIINAGWIPDPAAPVNEPPALVNPGDPDGAGSTPGLSDRVIHVINNAAVTVDVQMSELTVMGGRTPEVTGLINDSGAADIEYYLRFNGGGLAVGAGAGTYDPLTAGEGGSKPVIVSGVPGPTYNLDLSNVTITQNYSGDGGGFYNGATTTASMVSISGNRGYANGGGIYNDGGLTLTNSTIDGNGAEGGGGIFDTGTGTRSIYGSTLSNNGGVGGGAYAGRSGVEMSMTNSTVSGNIARDMGGGLLTNGILNLVHVTIANNTATTDAPNSGAGVMTFPSGSLEVNMRGVLLNKNLVGLAAPPSNADCGAVGGGGISLNLESYNLSEDTTCDLTDTSDYNSVDAMLVALADNGGSTFTHALPASSTAVNNGGPLAATTVDQRGVARDSAPDIGAYELYVPATGGSSDSKNIFGCTLGKPGGFDPSLLIVVALSLLLLSRRKRKVVSTQE